MVKKHIFLIVSTFIFLSIFFIGNFLPADFIVLILIVYPFILFYYFRNLPTTWLWVITVALVILATKINIKNPAIDTLATVMFWAGFVFAIRRTFFVKTKLK